MKSATSNHQYELIIVGAGPAGLCLGQELKSRGVKDFCILEKSVQAGNSWAEMPEWLHIITYWRDNFLRPQDKNYFDLNSQVSAGDFTKYLAAVAKELPVLYSTSLQSLKKTPQGFLLQTSQGEFLAAKVIMATGYYSEPSFLDTSITAEAQIPIRHFAELKTESFSKDKKYLVVGRALSAGQVAEQLARAGIRFDISSRGPLIAGAGPKMQKFFLRHLTAFEALPKLLSPRKILRVPMEKTAKTAIDAAQASIKPVIEKIEGSKVTFSDGSQEIYDEVILGTGFQYAGSRVLKSLYPVNEKLNSDLQNLKQGFESTEYPGLFFLGVDNQVDFTSRFLRGIRRDARRLASLL